MPLITLDIPQKKMPLVKEFISEIGLKEKNIQSFGNVFYAKGQTNTRHYIPSHSTYSSKGWEFFCNELEFE